MEHTGNQSTLQSHVADDGINLFITADEIGIDQLDLFDVAAILSKFPREATVFALSRLAHIVHHSGEATKGIQEEICREFLPSPYRERALSLLEEENRVLVTYEGLVRLCYLSQLYSPARPSVSALPDEARTLLLFLIPSIHKAVFEPADLRLEAGLAELENIKQTRLFTFLAVNSVGLSFPAQEYLFHASVGALATEFISQGLTGGPLKELNRADAVLFQTYGTSLTELHASLLKLTMRWMHVPTEPGEIPSNYGDMFSLSGLKAGGNALLQAIHHLLVSGSTRAIPSPAPPPSTARAPRVCWNESMAWRPFFRQGDDVVCWDLRLLHSVLSFYFPRIIDRTAVGNAHGGIVSLWDKAIEYAVEAAIRAYVPTSGRPHSIPRRKGDKICDFVLADGADLFFIEFKNASLPRGNFLEPTPDNLWTWLRRRFFQKEGFEQVYSTIRRVPGSWRFDGRSLAQYQRVWPVVLTTVAVPVDPMFKDQVNVLAEQLLRRKHRKLRRTNGLMKPVLLGIEDFIRILACRNSLASAGVSLGDFVDSFETQPAVQSVQTRLYNSVGTFNYFSALYSRAGSAVATEERIGELLLKRAP